MEDSLVIISITSYPRTTHVAGTCNVSLKTNISCLITFLLLLTKDNTSQRAGLILETSESFIIM